jgi:hypothetical protein
MSGPYEPRWRTKRTDYTLDDVDRLLRWADRGGDLWPMPQAVREQVLLDALVELRETLVEEGWTYQEVDE